MCVLVDQKLSDDARLTSDVYLSRTSSLSREQRMKTKTGTEVAHVTYDSNTTFKVKRSKVNLQGPGAYCGSLPHTLLWTHPQRASMLYFADVFLYFFMGALVGQTAERIFTKLSHVVDIRCYLRTY